MPIPPRSPTGFPYAERARAAEQARLALHTAFREVRHRHDPDDPATRRWTDAIAAFHTALRLALPKDFGDDFKDVKAGKTRGLRSMVEFLAADPYFFRSGYLEADVITAVRKLPIPVAQADRLRRVVLDVLDAGDRREFRHYCRLARKVSSPELEAEIQSRHDAGRPGVSRRAGWMLYAIRQKA